MEKDEIKKLHDEYKTVKKFLESHGDYGLRQEIETVTIEFMKINALKKIEEEIGTLWGPIERISEQNSEPY